eukprot:m51a1_g11845 putative tkl mlk hh498 protein kinase (328) ;mRNA; f:475426-476757
MSGVTLLGCAGMQVLDVDVSEEEDGCARDYVVKAAEVTVAPALDPNRRPVPVVAYSQLNMKELIGRGTFSSVHRAELAGEDVAIKVFNNVSTVERRCREISILSTLDHPNIVGFKGVSWDEQGNPILLMEFCALGSLSEILSPVGPTTRGRRDEVTTKLSEDQNTRIAIGIARGLGYLHKQGYAHFDLCTGNVLLTGDMEPKVADFGQARRTFGVSHAVVGHRAYRAPELTCMPGGNYGASCHYTEKVDVFSYAIVLWSLWHPGDQTWEGDDTHRPKATRNRARPAISKHVPHHWSALIQSCWEERPQDRPSFEDIVGAIQAFGALR